MPRSGAAPFYEALGRNTERLHRLVESLLDFARMEAAGSRTTCSRIDAGDARSATWSRDFRRRSRRGGFTIELDVRTPATRPRCAPMPRR